MTNYCSFVSSLRLMAAVLCAQWWSIKANLDSMKWPVTTQHLIKTGTSSYGLDLVDIKVIWNVCVSKKRCTPTLGLSTFSYQILPMETHYLIHCDSSLCGFLAPISFSVQTRHLASCISTQNVRGQHSAPSTCAVPTHKTCHDPHPQIHRQRQETPWHWPADTHSHPQHNRHSSGWRNMRDPPWGMTPHWRHPADTASHTKDTTSFKGIDN